jgi:hypothetical protein
MPIVREVDETPDEIRVEIEIPVSAATPDAIEQSQPELQRHLADRWPVKEVTRSRLRRNPVSLTHYELDILIRLLGLVPVGLKIRDEVVKWYRRKFKGARKRRKRARR